MGDAAGGGRRAATRRFLYDQIALPCDRFSGIVVLDSPLRKEQIHVPMAEWLQELGFETDVLLPLTAPTVEPARLLAESTIGLAIAYWSIVQTGHIFRFLRTKARSTANPVGELQRHLMAVSNIVRAQVAIPGLKHLLSGLIGIDQQEYGARLVDMVMHWGWPTVGDGNDAPPTPHTPDDVPVPLRTLLHPATFAIVSVLGDNGVLILFLIVMMLAGGFASQQYRLWRSVCAHPACHARPDAAANGGTQFDRSYDIWLSTQAEAAPEAGMADYNHWRLRARALTLAYAMRSLVSAAVEHAASEGMQEDLDLKPTSPMEIKALMQFLQDKTHNFAAHCQGKPSASHTGSTSVSAPGDSGRTPVGVDNRVAQGKQGFDFIIKQVQRKGTKYSLPALTAGQLQWEEWFDALYAAPSKFSMTDEQVITACTDHLPSSHILISTWEDQCKTLRHNAQPITLSAFVTNARKRLFATCQVKHQAYRWFQKVLQDPGQHAEDCADLVDLIERILRRLFPCPDTDEVLNLTRWQCAQGHHAMLTKLRDTTPRFHGSGHALARAWKKYQFDSTAAYATYLKQELHKDRTQSDVVAKQYFDNIHAQLRTAHDMYEADRVVRDLFQLSAGAPARPAAPPAPLTQAPLAAAPMTPALDPKPLDCHQLHAGRKSLANANPDPKPGFQAGKRDKGKQRVRYGAVTEMVANPYGARRARDDAESPMPPTRATRHQPYPPSVSLHAVQAAEALTTHSGTPVSSTPVDLRQLPDPSVQVAATPPADGKRTRAAMFGPGDYYLMEANAPGPLRLEQLGRLVANHTPAHVMLERMQHHHCPLCGQARHPKGPHGCPSLNPVRTGTAMHTITTGRQQWMRDCRALGNIEQACAKHRVPVQLPRDQVPQHLRVRVL